MSTETTLTILNKKGLHARAAAKFVKAVEAHQAQVLVTKLRPANTTGNTAAADESEYATVSGTSILGLLMLAAEQGTQLHITASGVAALDVLVALRALTENKFGEE